MRMVGYTARVAEMRNMHRTVTAKRETAEWKDNIKMDLREVGSNDEGRYVRDFAEFIPCLSCAYE
jgi:hypothetical protein